MSGILDHVWGKSHPVDRVWAQVSGLSPRKAGERLFMVLQAFIDDSQKGDWFVLGGYIATADAWAKFSADWEEILPYSGLLTKDGRPYFKMSHMADSFERAPNVAAFYRVIEKHVLIGLSCAVDLKDLRRALKRISIPGRPIDWDKYANPYLFTFRCLMDNFHSERAGFSSTVLADEKVDFYFDMQAEKKVIFNMWDNYILARDDEIRRYYGSTPRFEDDLDFLPLQAADFWAWWVRYFEEQHKIDDLVKGDFGHWKANRPLLCSHIGFTEDDMVTNLMNVLRASVGNDELIIDTKFFLDGYRV
jgi:hypothetical protein